MAAIESLLNPLPGLEGLPASLPSPSSTVFARDLSFSPHSSKKQKIAKDAAIFNRGNIRGECRYPPCEYRDDVLAGHHQQHEIHPIGHIAEFPRHIPYNSEKKSFLEKTGRGSFEVFQYTFKVHGDERTHSMIWDYNIGLVRTTPLFRCNGYSKTTPAKVLNRNPGLRDISHSITGGSLVAQGYWMPFEAAKAIAATFCWNMRYALTPVFGTDFPAMCIPQTSDRYGEMIIDSAIIQRCTEQQEAYRNMANSVSSRVASTTGSPMPPDSPTPPTFTRRITQLRPRSDMPSDSSTDYSTDSSYEVYAPARRAAQAQYRNTWTAANVPRSVTDSGPALLPPNEILTSGSVERLQASKILTPSSTATSPSLNNMKRSFETDEDYDGDSSEMSETSSENCGEEHWAEKEPASPILSDEKAACLLLSLGVQKFDIEENVRSTKRRASA